MSELAAGTQLSGYTIVREIGAGGMATVYEARQLSLDRPVAIKVLGAEQSADLDMVERFRREAKAAPRSITRTWCGSSTRAAPPRARRTS